MSEKPLLDESEVAEMLGEMQAITRFQTAVDNAGLDSQAFRVVAAFIIGPDDDPEECIKKFMERDDP